jgi:DNA repair protein RadD
MQLYDYQQRAVDEAILEIRNRPLLVAPTGAGKTVMAVEIVRRLGVPAVWMAHRHELLEQAAVRLRAEGLHVGVMRAGESLEKQSLWYQDPPQVYVASTQLLCRRKQCNLPPARLIVFDEAHHAASPGNERLIEKYEEARREIDVLGLTATPFRTDGRGLGGMFGRLVIAATTRDLVEQGALIEPKVYASKSPDLRGLKIYGGDFAKGEMSERAQQPELLVDIVDTWRTRADGARTVAFACDVAHSQAIAQAFRSQGVPAEHLDGTTPKDDREAMLDRLRRGETLVLSNCAVLTEGWDLPALECAILARPTMSLGLHLQMVGRIMRLAADKSGAIVLDHAGNHHTHGMVTRRLEYSLSEADRVGESDPLGLKRCGRCGLFFSIEYARCPECGWMQVPKRRRLDGEYESAELVEFDDGDFAYRQTVWNMIEAERLAWEYKEGWSTYRYKERFGDFPVIDGDRELVDPDNATQAQKRDVFMHLKEVAEERGFKPGWVSHRYRGIFGVWPKGFVQQARRGEVVDGIRRRFGVPVGADVDADADDYEGIPL